MITWIKIFLFGGSALITPEPIALGIEPVEVEFTHPVEALDDHASFNINVSEHVMSDHFQEFTKEVSAKFPEGCIIVLLFSNESDPVLFNQPSVTWNHPGDVSVNLKSADGVLTGKKYTSLRISSCRDIERSEITWYNYGKP